MKKAPRVRSLFITGGSGEIRTHEGIAPLPVFKTGPFNHSGTLPNSTLTGLSNRQLCRFIFRAIHALHPIGANTDTLCSVVRNCSRQFRQDRSIQPLWHASKFNSDRSFKPSALPVYIPGCP